MYAAWWQVITFNVAKCTHNHHQPNAILISIHYSMLGFVSLIHLAAYEDDSVPPLSECITLKTNTCTCTCSSANVHKFIAVCGDLTRTVPHGLFQVMYCVCMLGHLYKLGHCSGRRVSRLKDIHCTQYMGYLSTLLSPLCRC